MSAIVAGCAGSDLSVGNPNRYAAKPNERGTVRMALREVAGSIGYHQDLSSLTAGGATRGYMRVVSTTFGRSVTIALSALELKWSDR